MFKTIDDKSKRLCIKKKNKRIKYQHSPNLRFLSTFDFNRLMCAMRVIQTKIIKKNNTFFHSFHLLQIHRAGKKSSFITVANRFSRLD